MKRIILLIQILSLLFIVSCVKKTTYVSFEYVNNTDYSIVIKTYNRYENLGLVDSINLQIRGGSWETKEFDTSKGELTVSTALNTDSIVVIFNNKKISSYIYSANNKNDRNIIYNENYELIMNSNTKNKRRFTFTNEDYNNAEEIVDGG